MIWIFYTSAALIYFLDVLTKIVVRRFMTLGSEIPLLPFFSLVHIENTGIAFGMFQGRNFLFLLSGVVMVAVIICLGIGLAKKSALEALAVGFVLGGAVGNITDRLLFGRVTDFLDFFVGLHHWPAFNVADSAICVGAALMLWVSLRRSPKGD